MSLVSNKKVTLNYEILEKLEAGIELLGLEVKSLRAGQGKLDGSYVVVRGGEAFVIGLDIPAFQKNNTPSEYQSARNRRLLLTKKEIEKVLTETEKKGISVIPLSIYPKARKIKIEIAFVRGKKKFDKRETIKKRDTEREIRRLHKFS